MLTKTEANRLRGLISRKVSRERALWALNTDTRNGCDFEHLRAGVLADLKEADEALWGELRVRTLKEDDANWEPDWFFVLMLDGAFVAQTGFIAGKGTYLHAKRFMNIGDARVAQAAPGWHNDPADVQRARPVKLRLRVEATAYGKAET